MTDVSGKIVGPSDAANEIRMQRGGYFFADRTVQTTISLSKITVDLGKFIRLPIVETSDYKDEILRIAASSFPYDRRFHVRPDLDGEAAAAVLKDWVDDLDKTLVALFKDVPVGFLALRETAADTLFVHLAAVEEKYRMTGAAMALYARACQIAKERGFKKLCGRISTQNTAVMNVYAAFGATFSEPRDIFIKEVKNDA